MKNTPRFLLTIAAIGMTMAAQAQNPGDYVRNNVRLLKQVSLSAMPTSPTSGAGCVGYVSPSGKEYAIMGVRNGNVVYNITNGEAPVLVGHIPGPASSWHEVCVLGDFAYATTEAGGGIQIIDLRQVDQGIVTLAATYTGNGVSSGHTIQAIPNSKLIVINGGNGIAGLRALDCQNPTAPVQVGTWNTKYVHDALYKQYTTGTYAGKTICFAFCANGTDGGMYIIDVTTTPNGQGRNIPAMTTLGFIRYFPNATNFYSHSGVLSPDGRFIFANDEFDEMNNLVTDASTHIINIENLSQPSYAGKFTNPINAIDHNSMVQDGFVFLAAYRAGLRIYDAQNPLTMTETGFFDSYHNGTGKSFDGAWGTWVGYPSGNAIISDMNRGLFIVDPSEAKGWGSPITNISYTGFTGPAEGAKKLRRPDLQTVRMDLTAGTASVNSTHMTDSRQRAKVDVSIRAQGRRGKDEIVKLYVVNQENDREKLVATWTVTNTQATFTVPNLDGSLYIKGDGSVRVRVELQGGKKGDASIDLDLIKVSVHN